MLRKSYLPAGKREGLFFLAAEIPHPVQPIRFLYLQPQKVDEDDDRKPNPGQKDVDSHRFLDIRGRWGNFLRGFFGLQCLALLCGLCFLAELRLSEEEEKKEAEEYKPRQKLLLYHRFLHRPQFHPKRLQTVMATA